MMAEASARSRRALRRVSSSIRPGNVVMFHGGRCGSSVLGLMLEETRRILWVGEVYDTPLARGALPVASDRTAPFDYLERQMVHAGSRYYGFEVKFQHLRTLALPSGEYIERVERLGVDHFIVLRRRNTLRVLVSVIAAAQDGRYHQRSDAAPVLRRVTVGIEKRSPNGGTRSLVERLQEREDELAVLDRCLVGRNVLRLVYEEDVNVDPRLGYRRICSFLGIKARDVPVRLGRTNPFPLRDTIVNVDEVEEALRSSPFEWMLDEQSS